jgi:hypothetical protein
MTPFRGSWTSLFFAIGTLSLVVAAAAYGTLHAAYGPRPASVHVTWAPGVEPEARQWLERRYSLTEGERLDGRTWGYTLVNPSEANVKAIVTDASVEDTHDIDRAAFRVRYSAEPLPYPTSHQWIPVHLSGLSILCFFIGMVAVGLGVIERAVPGTAAAWFSPQARRDGIFLLILLAALLIRLSVARTAPYFHDEENNSIPIARSISFAPDHLQLPLRGRNHPALPAYFVKISSTLFGATPLGYRWLHLLGSLCTIVMIFFLTAQWYGPVAARWAAALLAFNEYYLGVSSHATAHVPYLLFTGAAIYAFGRFLSSQRSVYLYPAGVALGLAFYCKEHAALMLPVFLLMLLDRHYRHWFRSPHVYAACALFFLVIGPDLFWNLTAREGLQQATYADHLQRAGGIGVSPYPIMFYARDVVQWLHRLVTGRALFDPTTEYPSMNSAIGALLLGAVLAATWRWRAIGSSRYLLLVFWVVFGSFASIRPGGTPKDLDPVSWIWVDVTLLPAVILAGVLLSRAKGRLRVLTSTFACMALLMAAARFVG